MDQIFMPIVGTLTFLGGYFGGQIAKRNEGWYKSLNHPHITPPASVFRAINIVLHMITIAASLLVWTKDPSPLKNAAMLIFVIHLVMNWVWAYLFFEVKNMEAALAGKAVLAISASICQQVFSSIDSIAGMLILPYSVYIVFTFTLNFGFVMMNPQERKWKFADIFKAE